MFPVISVAPVRNGYVSDKSIDFPMMHSYGTVGATRADSIRCSMMFTQVAVRQLTDPKIRAGCGSEFLQASDGAGGKAGEDLMCCCLCVILHLLTCAGLCAKSISVCVDNKCACMCKCESMCACMHACVCVCVSLLSSFGEEDEQRSKVTAHKAALKVIRVIPALGSSCSFPLPRTH